VTTNNNNNNATGGGASLNPNMNNTSTGATGAPFNFTSANGTMATNNNNNQSSGNQPNRDEKQHSFTEVYHRQLSLHQDAKSALDRLAKVDWAYNGAKGKAINANMDQHTFPFQFMFYDDLLAWINDKTSGKEKYVKMDSINNKMQANLGGTNMFGGGSNMFGGSNSNMFGNSGAFGGKHGFLFSSFNLIVSHVHLLIFLSL
jgi:hypothetical protein